ncbi:PIN domain-containing protein [Mannheimia pernigra]|uniref:PIN domain-containing protein n=1 Tax=Mannheimia pernigra TaxID=111844 RepID=UPI001CEFA83E|nr:PIN domain-containing protein [Mannheimia pernigra]
MQQLLVSDANIVIDLEAGNLLELFFKLPYQFITPDILFEEELKAQHTHLLKLGLVLYTLNEESMIYAFELKQKNDPTSLNDLFCLSLARQERCSLLTGDRALRKVAGVEAVQTNGTIWILE